LKGVTQHSTTTKRDAKDKTSRFIARLGGARQQQWWGAAALFLAITGVVFTGLAVQRSLALGTTTLPTISQLNRGVTIYDKNDKFVCTLRADADRKAIPISKISPHMRNAIVAAEDRRFYSHHGIDPQGVVRALYRNHQAGRIVEGGSTITQQLAKNLYCDKKERSYDRKIKEAKMAFDIEMKYPKAKILETYLNVVYFGGGVCGIERAAQYYFNKPAANLNPAESAWLAALVKAPSDLSFTSSPKTIARQKEILDIMGDCGYLTPAKLQEANQAKLAFQHGPLSRPWPHYIGCVEQVLETELGADLWKGGWKVYTNLDVNAQRLAEATVNNGIKNAPRGIDQGALVTMSLKDAAVVAIVGGAGAYETVQWNRAVHPHTAGSTFKPFVYLAGLQQGIIQPDTMINDAPLKIDDPHGKPYEPKNFDGRFAGWVTVRNALAGSRNVCSVRVAQETGLGQVIDTARAAGIRAQLDAYPSLALGACAVSPMDMTTAYATLARGGVYMAPQIVRRIDTESGSNYRTYHATPSANLATESTLQLLDVLQDVVRCGTGTRARIPGVSIAGKTGTSNNSKDIWFVGFTPETITTVWAGNDLNKPVRGARVTGGVVMAKIWHDFMSSYLKSHPTQQVAFTRPAKPLIQAVPEYAENQLFYEQIAANGGDGVDNSQFSAAQLASQVNNVPDLEKATTVGIGRAYDIQKLAAIKRLQNTDVASNPTTPTDTVYNGVSNYSYNQSGDYAASSATPSTAYAHGHSANSNSYAAGSSYTHPAATAAPAHAPAPSVTPVAARQTMPATSSVWNTIRRSNTSSFVSHRAPVVQEDDDLAPAAAPPQVQSHAPAYSSPRHHAGSEAVTSASAHSVRILNHDVSSRDVNRADQTASSGSVIYVR